MPFERAPPKYIYLALASLSVRQFINYGVIFVSRLPRVFFARSFIRLASVSSFRVLMDGVFFSKCFYGYVILTEGFRLLWVDYNYITLCAAIFGRYIIISLL